MNPSIGRIVHYQSLYNEPQAAIITETYSDGAVNLTVFTPGGGPKEELGVKFSDEPKIGYWSWPPRV